MYHIHKLNIIYFLIACNIQYCNTTSFWNTPKHGTNVFNATVSTSLIKSAKERGIDFIRLAPDKFKTNNRDFLFVNTDNYEKIDYVDMCHLKNVLDLCYQNGMPVVLTFLSLPGSRWRQNNNNVNDLKIWQDKKYQEQAAQFWEDLVKELKGHPAIVGYNILNEPHPEKLYSNNFEANVIDDEKIQQQLFEFYQLTIQKIRTIDPDIAIVIDASGHADPCCFANLIPLNDKNILYSFHMYEPFSYTCHALNRGQYTYPNESWNREYLKQLMLNVIEFQKKYEISSSRILVGEFGCNRFSKGINNYFADLIALFNANSWHWAFYAYQEDTWDGMDYELGLQNVEQETQKNMRRHPKNNIIFALICKSNSAEPLRNMSTK